VVKFKKNKMVFGKRYHVHVDLVDAMETDGAVLFENCNWYQPSTMAQGTCTLELKGDKLVCTSKDGIQTNSGLKTRWEACRIPVNSSTWNDRRKNRSRAQKMGVTEAMLEQHLRYLDAFGGTDMKSAETARRSLLALGSGSRDEKHRILEDYKKACDFGQPGSELHKQPAVRSIMNQFEKEMDSIKHQKCTKCKGRWFWGEKSMDAKGQCPKCSNDIRKYGHVLWKSLPSPIHPDIRCYSPEYPDGLNDIEQMLISPAWAIMSVIYSVPQDSRNSDKTMGTVSKRGQRRYRGNVLNMSQDIEDFTKKLLLGQKLLPHKADEIPMVFVRRNDEGKIEARYHCSASKLERAIRHFRDVSKHFSFRNCKIDQDTLSNIGEGKFPEGIKVIKVPADFATGEPAVKSVVIQSTCVECEEKTSVDDEKEDDSQFLAAGDVVLDTRPVETCLPQTKFEGRTQVEILQDAFREANEVLVDQTTQCGGIRYWDPEDNAFLLSKLFPFYFPDGKGDPFEPGSLESKPDAFKRLLYFADENPDGSFSYRFAESKRFIFWCYNYLHQKRLNAGATFWLKNNPGEAAMTNGELQDILRDKAKSKQFIKRVSHHCSRVKGTDSYWHSVRIDVETIIREKGPPTLFYTLSAADTRWERLHRLMGHPKNKHITYNRRNNRLRAHPHVAAHFFHKKVEIFNKYLNMVLDKEWDWNRYEFQHRGSIHLHGFKKLKNDPGLSYLAELACEGKHCERLLKAGKLGKYTKDELQKAIALGKACEGVICMYSDWLHTCWNKASYTNGGREAKDVPIRGWSKRKKQQHPSEYLYTGKDGSFYNVKGDNPREEAALDKDYYDLLNFVERHSRCGPGCWRLHKHKKEGKPKRKKKGDNGSEHYCRYKYPFRLSNNTYINYVTRKRQDGSEQIEAKLVLKRNDARANKHCRLALHHWRANVDFQIVLNARVVLQYITKYSTKPEKRSQQANNVCSVVLDRLQQRDPDANAMAGVRSIMTQMNNQRDTSVQECALSLLGDPLSQSDFRVIGVNLGSSRAVNPNVWSNDRKETFQVSQNIVDIYAQRTDPEACPLYKRWPHIKDMSLEQFAKSFWYHNGKKQLVPRAHPTDATKSKETVVRWYPAGRRSVTSDEFPFTCRQYLTMYHPWIGSPESLWDNDYKANAFQRWKTFLDSPDATRFMNYHVHATYEEQLRARIVHEEPEPELELGMVEDKTNGAHKNAAVDAIQELPELKKKTAAQQALEELRSRVRPTFDPKPAQGKWTDGEIEDMTRWLTDTRRKLDKMNQKLDEYCHSLTIDDEETFADYEKRLKLIADKRKEIEFKFDLEFPVVRHDRVNIEDATPEQMRAINELRTYLETPLEDRAPFRMAVFGTAGTGKSWLIAAIRQILADRKEMLSRTKPTDPELRTLGLKVTALTGIAGVNVDGTTIHGAARINNFQMKDLVGEAFMSFENDWDGTRWLIIDEVSMMGQKMWLKLSRRMKQLCKDRRYDGLPLGNMNILIFGDHGQLAPINDYIASKKVPWLNEGRAAYLTFENMVELTEVKRLDSTDPDAARFREALLQVRTSELSHDNKLWLMQRQIRNLDADEQRDFRENATRLYHKNDDRRLHNLRSLVRLGQPIAILRAHHSRPSGKHRSSKEFDNIEAEIDVAVGARVILRKNVKGWTAAGLANGAFGTIREIVYATDQVPGKDLPVLLIEFDKYKGPRFSSKCSPTTVPINSHRVYKKHGYRENLPIDLAYALTVHKSQGLTLPKVYYTYGDADQSAGQTFVPMSRVRRSRTRQG
jgi:DNA replication protein DnaC